MAAAERRIYYTYSYSLFLVLSVTTFAIAVFRVPHLALEFSFAVVPFHTTAVVAAALTVVIYC